MQDGQPRTLAELRVLIAAALHLSPADLQERTRSGQNLFHDSVGYAVNNLYHAQCLVRMARGTYRITPFGHQALRDNPGQDNLESYLQARSELYRRYRHGAQDESPAGSGASRDWSWDEAVLVYAMYCLLSCRRLTQYSPEVSAAASLMQRPPAQILTALRGCDALDQGQDAASAAAVPAVFVQVRERYMERLDELCLDSSLIYSRMCGRGEAVLDADEFLPGLSLETAEHAAAAPPPLPDDVSAREGLALTRVRRNQHFFRRSVLNHYGRRCCVCGLSEPRLLEAAHIAEWSAHPEIGIDPANGLCLSVFFHKAYDLHLVSVTPDYVFRVSPALLAPEPDGQAELIRRCLTAFEGTTIFVPEQPRFRPRRELLDAHYQIFIRG